MRKLIRSFGFALAALTFSPALTGCGGPSAEPVSAYPYPAANDPITAKVAADEARGIAEAALAGYNTRDYALYATRWDASMRSGISPEKFAQWRDGQIATTGAFRTISEVRLVRGAKEGFVRYVFRCDFDKGEHIFVHAYPQDGDLVVGAALAPLAK